MGLPIEKLDLTLIIINEGIFNLFRFLGRHIFWGGINLLLYSTPLEN